MTIEAKSGFESESECRIAGVKALAALGADGNSSNDSGFEFPKTIGDYEIVRPLGKGGMGQVFLGRHTKLGRTVAIKCIANHRLFDESAHARFAAEMQHIGGLSHPNIVQAFDARETDGMAVLVTEFIDGLNVNEIVKRQGALEVNDACRIGLDVCKALEYVDSKGMIHRDVKPSNIMIDKTGQVKLLDLGLARLNTNADDLTMTGQAIGTVDYVAPEQIDGGRDVDFRSDLYALGCTLYKLLTGNAPFDNGHYPTALAKLNAHANDQPQRAADIVAVPAKLQKLLDRMLQKNPEKRPQSFNEVTEVLQSLATKAELKELVEEALAKDSPSQNPVRISARQKNVGGRSKWPVWTAIAAGLAGMLFGIWLGITITIKKPNGEIAKLIVPDGATAMIDAEGNVSVDLASGNRALIEKENVSRGEVSGTKAFLVELPSRDPALVGAEAGDLVDFFQQPKWSEETGLIRRKMLAGKKPIVAIRPDQDGVDGEALVSIELSAKEKSEYLAARDQRLETRIVGYQRENHIKNEISKLFGAYRVTKILANKSNVPVEESRCIVFTNDKMIGWDSREFSKFSIGWSMDFENQIYLTSDSNNENLPEQFGLSYQFETVDRLKIGMHAGYADKKFELDDAFHEMRLERIKKPRNANEEKALHMIGKLEPDPSEPRLSVHLAYFAKGDGAISEDTEVADVNVYGRPKTKLQINTKPFLTNQSIVSAELTEYLGGCAQLQLTPEGGQRFWTEFHDQEHDAFLVNKIDGSIVSATQSSMKYRADHSWERHIQFGIGLEKTSLKKLVDQINGRQKVEKTPPPKSDGKENLRKIALAFLMYESNNAKYPASKNVKNGGKPFSWRIAILPFLEQDALYNEYRFDEAWDSEHNKKLISKMPAVYRHPSAAKDSTTTWYAGFADQKSALGVEKGHNLGKFSDGTSNTLLVVETDSGIPWTKPEDLPFNDAGIRSVMDPKKSPSESGFLYARCDGSASFLTFKDAKKYLRHLITRAGQDAVPN